MWSRQPVRVHGGGGGGGMYYRSTWWLVTSLVAIASAGMSSHRCLIIHMENLTAWSPRMFPDLFEAKLRCHPDDVFDVLHAAQGERVPVDASLTSYDAIVITGSHYDCLSERGDAYFDWYNPVIDVVRHAAAAGRPRIFGSCFGSNLMVFALGGVVSRLPGGKYVLQAETLTTTPEFFTTMAPSISTAPLLQTYTVLSTHEHHCESLPPGAVVLGSTLHCRNYFFTLGQHGNLLGLQGHPEFELDYCVKERIFPSVVGKMKRLTAVEVADSIQSFEDYTPDDANRLCDVIAAFLRGA